MPLGNNVRVYREARRQTLRQVAEAVGMDPAHLSRLERGVGGCGDEVKVRLAHYFGVGVTRLFFVEGVDKMDTGVATR